MEPVIWVILGAILATCIGGCLIGEAILRKMERDREWVAELFRNYREGNQ